MELTIGLGILAVLSVGLVLLINYAVKDSSPKKPQ